MRNIKEKLVVLILFTKFATILTQKMPITMSKTGFFYRVFDLYYDGFRNMTLGRTLWLIILVKLVVIFVVLKIFFFPNHIQEHAAEGEEAEYVASEVLQRASP